MANRIPRFESHIRPMIRRRDREAMLAVRGFDLWKFEDVKDLSDDILGRLKRGLEGTAGAMPPSDVGGPWPEEWVSLFERWMGAGFQRLELATATYTVSRLSPQLLTLTATGTNPTFGFATWLERELDPTGPLQFILYREPPTTVPPFGSLTFSTDHDFTDTGERTLFVTDGNGRQQVDFTGV
jgi:hypothetical protein